MNPVIKKRIETHSKHLTHAMDEVSESIAYHKETEKFDYSHLIRITRLMLENLIILDEYHRLEYSCKENEK